MNEFGTLLRNLRESCDAPDFPSRKLSQQKFGEFIGKELGTQEGYSGAAVSDWERGKSKIHADDRLVLVAILKVLHEHGSLRSVEIANQLLESGNYRALNAEEIQKIFGNHLDESRTELTVLETENTDASPFWLAGMFSIPQEELNKLFAKAKQGPEPSWPRVLAAFMRRISDRFSLSLATILSVAIWLLTVWLVGPSLRLPFESRNAAFVALCLYAGCSLIIPLLIGMLVTTKDNEYWKQQRGVSPFLLRLYTYQGAGIGFNVGYFLIFSLTLLLYYLGFQSTHWVGILAASISVILSSMAARVVPHNLWLAYQRLTLHDGGIFFVVAFIGPFWGWFFLEYYSLLLTPVLGWVIILLALTGVVFIARYLKRQAVSDPSTI